MPAQTLTADARACFQPCLKPVQQDPFDGEKHPQLYFSQTPPTYPCTGGTDGTHKDMVVLNRQALLNNKRLHIRKEGQSKSKPGIFPKPLWERSTPDIVVQVEMHPAFELRGLPVSIIPQKMVDVAW
mmetsp:Transcript_75814/g.149889  ORF Transcript_75814/g.149889 Transcript_75814/m.149889 type:complete len:127 (+) Transcript_75814:151-531(+)